MKKIGLISDTHSFLHPRVKACFKDCDEIWHAGDIGNLALADELADFKAFKAVYGNIDGEEIRKCYPEDLWLRREGLQIWMTHIGGYPPKYNNRVREILENRVPDIFICGHSHILKVVRDEQRNRMLCLNPGAVGRQGVHKTRTMLRFEIISGKLKNMEAIELGPK